MCVTSLVVASLLTAQWSSPVTAESGSNGASGNRWRPVLPAQDGEYSIWFREQSNNTNAGAVCATTTDLDCISGVWAVSRGGTRIEGSEVSVDGVEGGLWRFPGVLHSHGDLFLVSASFPTVNPAKPAGYSPVLSLEVIPVELADEPFNWGDTLAMEKSSCVQPVGVTKCLRRSDFPADTRFGIALRGSARFAGFGIGRMSSVGLSVEASGNGSIMSIEASPVTIPAVAIHGRWSELGAEVQSWFKTHCIDGFKVGTDGECRLGSSSVQYKYPNAEITSAWIGNPASMRGVFTDYIASRTYLKATPAYRAFSAMRPALRDTASALTSSWSVVFSKPGYQNHSCLYLDKGLSGLIATNALFFSRTTPLFDNELDALVLDLAGPHYAPDGRTPIQGSYDLILRKDVADCLFALSESFAAPDGAYAEETVYLDGNTFSQRKEETIEPDVVLEVSREDAADALTKADSGEDKGSESDQVIGGVEVVTAARLAVVKENGKPSTTQFPSSTTRLDGGWFHLSTRSFTFSDPVIKSRISVLPARSTWCLSGEKLFRVSGQSAPCPRGLSKATMRYCASGSRIGVLFTSREKCPDGHRLVSRLECARKSVVRVVFGSKPRCPAGFGALGSVICVNTKTGSARTVRAVAPRCVNGFKRALVVTCRRNDRSFKVTAVRPVCPKGSSRA